MQDIAPDHSQAAVHEYTHLVVQHLKLELPIWLNEGMAGGHRAWIIAFGSFRDG
jgi:hypothetical protein